MRTAGRRRRMPSRHVRLTPAAARENTHYSRTSYGELVFEYSRCWLSGPSYQRSSRTSPSVRPGSSKCACVTVMTPWCGPLVADVTWPPAAVAAGLPGTVELDRDIGHGHRHPRRSRLRPASGPAPDREAGDQAASLYARPTPASRSRARGDRREGRGSRPTTPYRPSPVG